MIQFGNLTVRGFCSILELDLNLDQKGITIIKGPNGKGKTTLLSSIVWALYGKSIKGVQDVNMWQKHRPDGYNGTMVGIHWKSNGSTYKVVRCLKYKDMVEGARGDSRLILIKDAVVISDKKKTDIQSAINSAIGMSYNLFMTSIMFGQGLKRIIQESSNDQKDIFEEIFDLSYLSNAQLIAKAQYQELHSKYLGLENIYAQHKSSLQAYQNNLDLSLRKAKEYSEERREKLEKLKARKKLATKALLEIRDKRPIFDANTFSKLSKDIKDATKALAELNEKVGEIQAEALVDETITLLKAGKTAKALHKLEGIKSYFTKVVVSKTYLAGLKEDYWKMEKAKSQCELHNEKVESKEREKESIRERLQEIKDEVAPTINTEIKTKIVELEGLLEKVSKDMKAYQEDRDVMKWVYSEPLGPNGMKAYIFDSSVDELNDILKEFSDILGIHVMFMVDTTSVRKDFETIIKLEGNLVLFEELSGGQKQLVHLAMALAMNQLVTRNHQVNVTFLDEVFESLSYDNIEVVVNLLRKVYKDRNLFMITHHDSLPLSNARTIMVSKDKGISRYNF